MNEPGRSLHTAQERRHKDARDSHAVAPHPGPGASGLLHALGGQRRIPRPDPRLLNPVAVSVVISLRVPHHEQLLPARRAIPDHGHQIQTPHKPKRTTTGSPKPGKFYITPVRMKPPKLHLHHGTRVADIWKMRSFLISTLSDRKMD